MGQETAKHLQSENASWWLHVCLDVLDSEVFPARGLPGIEDEPGGSLGRPSICDLEVGNSARNGQEWDMLVGALDAFTSVDTTAAHLRRALQVQRLLARRSQRGRKIPDLLVAAAAEDLDVPVLHYDADFDLIASVTGQLCQWVVPTGTVE